MSSSDTPGVTPPEPPARGEADAVLFAFRRNVVVAASAGTGKTHRLTALYLLLALGLTSMGQPDERTAAAPLAPERIVATTFSRAAALEISRRVEHALRSFAGWDGVAPIPFADAVIARQARLGAALDPLRDPRSRSLEAAELRRRAAEALGRWGSARIDTLHGVAGQIARAHALALGLPPGARVLEEDEAQALGDLAVDEALGQALEGGGARAEAARGLVAAAGGVAGARAAVTRLLDRLDEEGLSPGELVLADHAAAARTAARELVRVARAAAVGGSEALRAPAASVAAELGTFAAELEAAGEAALPTLPAGAARAIAELFAVRKITGRARTAADEEIAEFIASLPGGKKEARAHHLAAWLAEAPALGARERAMVELLERARSLAAASRRRARALGFGDLLRAARDGLRDRPEVGRAVRHGIDALLVDEFQDTSRVQRDLVYLLRQREDASQARPASGGSATEPRRAGRGAARPEPTAAGLAAHGLFLVGDRKQSIYGFRGADVAVFSRICAELAGRAAGEALRLPEALWSAIPEGAEVADFVALRESRRSGAAILDLVNAFAERDFAPAGAARDFEVAYGPAEQLEPAPAADRGRGEVVVVRDDGATPDGAEPLVRGATGAMREAFVAAAMVAREARAGVAFRDVAVLARRRSTIPLVELALGRLGVPYVVAGRALFDAREVRDVAAALRLLLDPEDRLALATVLRGPMVGLSDAALALLSIPGKGLSVPLGRAAGRDEARAFDARAAALDPADRARLAAFRGRWEDLRRAALRVPPGEAIRIAVAALGYDRVLAALPRPEARLGNVDRLVTIARRRAGGAAATLAGFVRWLDRRIADEADEAEAAVFSPEDDAVRLTTIHASKGLDFPVVVLVDLDAAPRGSVPGIALRPSTGADAAALVIRHVVRHPERPEPLSLTSAALKEARADNLARESAARARLGYVAMTRARDRLVFVGVPGEGKRGSAWRTLAAGLADGLLALHVTRFEEARALLEEPARAPSTASALPPVPGRAAARGAQAPASRDAAAAEAPRAAVDPERRPVRTLPIATTPLGIFRGCARRFRFRHLLGLDEPVSSGQLDLFGDPAPANEPVARRGEGEDEADPRDLGRAAHRVLETWPLERWGEATTPAEIAARLALEGLSPEGEETARIAAGVARFLEGSYARTLRDDGAVVRREEAFVLPVPPAAPAPGAAPVALALRGAMDLCVEREDGAVDVIDYKLSRPRADLSPYDFQLRAYALAARRAVGRAGGPVRAGVLFLGAAAEPTFLAGAATGAAIGDAEHQRFEGELVALGARFAEARASGHYEGEPEESCRRQRCGFLPVCHRR